MSSSEVDRLEAPTGDVDDARDALQLANSLIGLWHLGRFPPYCAEVERVHFSWIITNRSFCLRHTCHIVKELLSCIYTFLGAMSDVFNLQSLNLHPPRE